jgi:sugar/nucleoside kinase (ribokinase family)
VTKNVDILSPNHIELASLFNIELTLPIDTSLIETLAKKCLESGIGPSGAGTLVVRAGELGCCVFSRQENKLVWLPSYHKQENPGSANLTTPDKVIDPTGAGNAFLGGFAIGLLETKNDIKAACYGTVAASFAVEQTGLPGMVDTEDGRELWNNVSVRSRLIEYLLRVDR